MSSIAGQTAGPNGLKLSSIAGQTAGPNGLTFFKGILEH